MSRFKFDLATAADDAALRQRMSQDRMDGSISVSFRREPSYFKGAGVQGDKPQIIKCVDTRSNVIAGLGARLQLDAFVNGTSERIGYLADLRADPRYRGGTLLARGYRYLHRLHDDDPLPFYYSLILEGNTTALQNLTDARAGLPIYKDLGRILSPVIHLDIPRRTATVSGVRIEQASQAQLPAVFEFVRSQYSRYQFAPGYQASDVGGSRLSGMRAEDIYLAIKDNRIIGTVAAWDQRDFRQTHIERYDRKLQLLRPLYNAAAAITPLKPLPAVGDAITYFYLALVAVQGDDPGVFRALLSHLYKQRRKGPWHYFIAGLHEDHPLAEILSTYRSIPAAGQLFLIHYPEDIAQVEKLDNRMPHIEIGAV